MQPRRSSRFAFLRMVPGESKMKSFRPSLAILPSLLVLAALTSCRSSEKPANEADKTKSEPVAASTPAANLDQPSPPDETKQPEKNAPFKLGDLIQPFTPPKLEEL